MPMKKGGRKQYRKGRKSAAKKGMKIPRDTAQVSVTTPSVNMNANTVYSIFNASLSGSTRAQQVASAYQFYRIKRIIMKFKPIYDTFGAGSSGGNATVPSLYFKVDKDGSFASNTNLQTLKTAGCKAIRLDDKIITRSFAPAVQYVTSSSPGNGTTGGAYRVSPWLTTNANAGQQLTWAPSTVDHRGCVFVVEQGITPVNAGAVAQFDLTIVYEFKKPLWNTQQTVDPPVAIDLDELDPDKLQESQPLSG